MRYIAFILAVLAVVCAQGVELQSLLERARKGDDSALAQMERSGDVRDLRYLLRDHAYAGKSAVRLALARLGDAKTLQSFACRSITDDVDKMRSRLRDEYDPIGGAFTVSIYRELLDSDQRFSAFVKRNQQRKYSDVTVELPSRMVLAYLPKLLPNANIPSLPLGDWPEEEKDLKDRWRKWIDNRKDEIQGMQPKAQGVNFSSSFCAEFRSNDD